ncbi:hypothetical protein BV898_01223 [Hypsibius exemplaris]|uniref:Secreted protein n=1 Tax=Hypsibius exemplaris TaxID=2072580 RepID=A0A1W0XBY4_HYPEX|nr:hypothetical protein BV898_01223 [Hypsibius exemplaris]
MGWSVNFLPILVMCVTVSGLHGQRPPYTFKPAASVFAQSIPGVRSGSSAGNNNGYMSHPHHDIPSSPRKTHPAALLGSWIPVNGHLPTSRFRLPPQLASAMTRWMRHRHDLDGAANGEKSRAADLRAMVELAALVLGKVTGAGRSAMGMQSQKPRVGRR